MALALADAGAEPDEGGLRQRPRSSTPWATGPRPHAMARASCTHHLGRRAGSAGTKRSTVTLWAPAGPSRSGIVALALHHGYLPGTLNHHESQSGNAPKPASLPRPPQGEASRLGWG